jgi:predicted regulator of Ras-like GTPase activity (Roadblock/LC7/MglB family)
LSTKNLIDEVLKELKSVGGIESSAVITRDGLLVASDTSGDVDAETFAAMSASMAGAAETAITEVNGGTATRIIVEAANSKLSLSERVQRSVVALTKQQVPLGLVLI